MDKPNKPYIVAIFESKECEEHIPEVEGRKAPLPETPARVQTINKALNNLLQDEKYRPYLLFFEPKATTEDLLATIHKKQHLATVTNAVAQARLLDTMKFVDHDSDVIVTAGSQKAAEFAAGAVNDAVLSVVKLENIRRAFCNVRPPGHHACSNKASGFCLYNNVWFGAQQARAYFESYLQKPKARIAIIDWDVHHGDGTQSFVLQNPELFTYFVSIHQQYNTQFPGTGKECRKNRHNSVVICHNVPVDEGDEHVKKYFNDALIPSLKEWEPDLILISCGFDAHVLDPVGMLKYSTELYGWMTTELCKVADEYCEGRIVSVLEGGYSLPALEASSVAHVKALIGDISQEGLGSTD